MMFEHARAFDAGWHPTNGKYADAPKVLCHITTIRKGVVYYRHDLNLGKAQFKVDIDKFDTVFGREIRWTDNWRLRYAGNRRIIDPDRIERARQK